MKRALDVVLASLALVVLSPVLLVTAALVRREDGGPALFRQVRVGRHGRPFQILKFRTMREGAGPAITVAADPRITRVGAFLRRWKLDELPQLWNVLRGDMSLVGPRPEIPEYVRLYPEEWRQVLAVRPGITGPAQLDGVDEEEELRAAADPEDFYLRVLLPRKVQTDLAYARSAGVVADLRWLARTIQRIAVRRGRASLGADARLLAPRRRLIVVAMTVFALASYLAAFALRADFALPRSWWPQILESLPFLLGARLFAFRHYGLLRGWWRYTGIGDFVDIVKAVCVGSALFVTAIVLTLGAYAVPRSVVVIDGVLLVGFLSGSRLAARAMLAWGQSRAKKNAPAAVLVGDFRTLEPLVHQIVYDPDVAIRPVGLVDLRGEHRGYRLYGVPVLGGEDDLSAVLATTGAELALLAIPANQGATLRRIVSKCDAGSVRLKIVPTLRDVIDRRLSIRDLRDIEVDDLLGRAEVRLDREGLREELARRCVLITGAAGSIGSELARQIATYAPSTLVLVDRQERALALLHEELAAAAPGVKVVPLLSDIRNGARLRGIFATHRPEVVYHAAAYKHVPMMEMNPIEAVKNNVLGTRDLLAICDQVGVGKFVLISTDKAVKPINIMGSTKRVAERLLEGSNGRGCRKIAVRFGNVFGSDGSVVPILLRQIRDGGPVTITHPDATRYFMTIPEAVQLVLQASMLGRGGEIFVLDMGEPVRILDLAKSLIRLAGFVPDRDIEVRITGLRPGERLHEEALIDAAARPTRHDKIWVRPSDDGCRPLGDEIRRVEQLVHDDDQEAVLRWLRHVAAAGAQAETSA